MWKVLGETVHGLVEVLSSHVTERNEKEQERPVRMTHYRGDNSNKHSLKAALG